MRTLRERFSDGFGVVFFVGVGIVALDVVVAIAAGLLSLVV
ncbi:hypothetical protein [Streptomyces sp. ISL-98]|nr:hypothetical protein [Streptomyces sp. ISL-98]